MSPIGLCLIVALALSAGCSTSSWVSLRESPHNPLADQLKFLARGGPRPTDRTMLLLRQYDLERDLKGDAKPLLVRLEQIVQQDPSADKLYSIAEIAYLAGRKAEPLNPKAALDLYCAAVSNSYHYLFEGRFGQRRNPYDPQFRGACDLYNGSLEAALRIVQKQNGLKPGATQTVHTAAETMQLTIINRARGWKNEDFDHFEFVNDYEVKGLKNQYHTYGLGVPLIAVRKKQPAGSATEKYYPPGLSAPITAFLHLVPADPKHPDPRHHAVLELYDPLEAADLAIGGRRVPLETDLSTPLAYFLNQPTLRDLDLATVGLLRPDAAAKVEGLYLIDLYDPNKIPVVMVHGVWSSPITWMEMFNDLRSSPEIRDRYQFWFYLYPSGQPFWYSADQLRRDLAEMRHTLDPKYQQPALDRMVLVGHSMGGLVSKLQTADSGEEFWKLNSDRPVRLVKANDEVKAELARTYYFRANPTVKRVVTIGTPHRGSNFANSTTRWLGASLIRMPKMLSAFDSLRMQNPGAFKANNLIDVKTSIDSLSPKSPIFPVMLAMPHAPEVHFHNIVGRIPDQGFVASVVSGSGGSDGVVSVASAHLDDVDSELVVNADHVNIHRHPLSVLEVRRILLQHLNEIDLGPSPLERLPWTAQETPNDSLQDSLPSDEPAAVQASHRP